jgi:16S rRNA (guanine527-N7)-methyltransferase
MSEEEAKEMLKSYLQFTKDDIDKLEKFKNNLLEYNARYNLISKSTENFIWSRHILDSAQLIKYINFNNTISLADFGSGAGFPGIVLAIFNKNSKFHVKLFEKSSVKRKFLSLVKKNLEINLDIDENLYDKEILADIVVCRAFKKLDKIIRISRETIKKPHKIIILKGKNAQEEINNVSLDKNYSYKLENSITDIDSKIIIINAK